MTIIIGLNAFHGDSSACLIRDGVMIAAAEEERFRRIKHWAGFPREAIRYCLQEAGITLSEVDHIALNQNSKANLYRKIFYTVTRRPVFGLLMERIMNLRRRNSLEQRLAHAFPDEPYSGRVHMVEHHLAHLSSAFHVSPFQEAVAVSVDGFGDFASAAWGTGRGTELTTDARIYFPHSLGVFYQALTQYLGFPYYGDEYKVMGLSAYGRPTYLDKMHRIVRLMPGGEFRLRLKFFRHHRETIGYEWRGGAPSVDTLYTNKLIKLLGPERRPDDPIEQRHKDIACSVQAMYEEAFFHLLNALHTRYNLDALVLSGGCAMNSVANGKVTLKTHFKEVYVQSAAGDAGGAIGAAYSVWHKMGGGRCAPHDHAYWGPHFSNEEILSALDSRAGEIAKQECVREQISDEAVLCQQTAQAIYEGEIVGWFQGRMEWGPRALGNRSIVCDPRRADMKDILNKKIKRRESFRPFAPSVLSSAVEDWFELDGDVPFMMQVFQIRSDKRPKIPAVVHVDGSGRLQTVHPSANPRFHALISAFHDLSGVPMLLNTSFNENEPIVNSPEQALDCFLRTKMDRLVMGDWVLRRAAARH